MIQTRGRARKPGSRYIILADEAQHAMQHEIKKREELLDFVIGPSKYGPSQKVTDPITLFTLIQVDRSK